MKLVFIALFRFFCLLLYRYGYSATFTRRSGNLWPGT